MTNVRLGIQTGNFHALNPGAAMYQVIDSNTIQARRLGIFYNLHTGNPSPLTLSNNTITALADANETGWKGILMSSLSDVAGIASNNTIDGSGVSIPSSGYEIWNVKSDAPANISGGSVTGVEIGIFANNYEGYSTNASDGAHASISNLSITPAATGTGIRVLDSPSSTTHANVQLTVGADVIVTGGTNGVVVEGANAMVVSPLGNLALTGQTGKYIQLIDNANDIDATAVSFEGKLGSAMSLAELFATEDKIDHKIDLATLGFVSVKADNDYVTVNSFVAPNTAPLIQRAVDAASNGWTVNVNSGTYNENVTVDKELTLLSGFGSDNTIIDGNNSGSELATIFLPEGSNNVQIGSIGHGFTVKGIDGTAGLEKAAIYLQKTQSNITIEDNILEARGDAALQGEWLAVNNNITINANEITGQTFTGTEPATGDQFTVANVARQAISFGGGEGSTNAQNFEFTNNVISAITGVSDKGNGLVTLDLGGTNTITGNIFSGQTGPFSWRPALRVRGAGNYTINENSFIGNYQIGLERVGTSVDGTCNWWGSTSGNDVVSKIVGAVNYVSWLIDGTDNSSDPGFQPVPGSCLGTPVVVVLDSYTDETCLGSADGTIDITVTGGSTPYSFEWSNNATSEDLIDLETDSYNVVVTDFYGTTATLDANVVIVTVPDVTSPTITGTMDELTVEGCVAADATAAATTVAGLEAMGAVIEDNCTDDGDMVVTSEDASSGTCPVVVTRTYTVTDLLGNESTITQTINVQDVTVPTIASPAKITVHMNDGCNWVGDYGTAAATDNCTAIASIQIIGTPPTLGFVEGDNTVIWKAIDACGNVSLQCEQIVQQLKRLPSAVP